MKNSRIAKSLISILALSMLFVGCDDSDSDNDNTENDIEEEQMVVFNEPNVPSPDPVIHLADNLDEPDQSGFCIDTNGLDFSDTLQVHSCKPNGDDVLFYYDEETQQICSATYPGFCAAMVGGPEVGMIISLIESDTESSEQKFIYDTDSREFVPVDNTDLCLAVGDTTNEAGPFVSRILTIQPREGTDVKLKTWVLRGSNPNI